MSHKNYQDTDFDLDYDDDSEDFDFEPNTRTKHKFDARRRVENMLERKRLRKMTGMDDDYWSDE